MSVHFQVLAWMFVVAVVLGAVMHKTRFCTMGAVSDWVNIGHKGRMGAWWCAIATAIAGVALLEGAGLVQIPAASPEAFPPYRTAQFAWLRYLLGGFVFGIGMTLAGGCASRTFVRVGGGSMKALVVLIVASLGAYAMMWTPLYATVFQPWIAATTIDLQRWNIASQELANLLAAPFGSEHPAAWRAAVALAVSSVLIVALARTRDFRERADNVFGGVVVGLAVVAGWYISGGPLHAPWMEEASFSADPPIRVAVQSFTSIAPMADTFNYVLHLAEPRLLAVGVAILAGMTLGSFAHAIAARRFRIEWFASFKDFLNHVVGGVLLALGGVLAMGCSLGQGITGVSTLALGSFLALAAMIAGSAVTMKLQYRLLDR